jgi:general secretion pathway protein H
MWARPSRAGATSGFTLLELLVVIAIMSALTAAFPLALNRFVAARRVDAAARELLADIRLAQSRSVITDRPVDVVPVANGYEVRTASGSGVNPVTSRQWRTTTALALRSVDDSRDQSTFRVFPDGSSTGGRFSIRDGERVRCVIVSELTSRVRIEAGDLPAAVES